MQRRDFLKLSATAGAVSCVTACGSKTAETVIPEQPPVEKVSWSACLSNCGSNCPLKVHTVDGVITRIESESQGDDSFGQHHIRPCARGRSVRKRIYSPDRLLKPMKQMGERGDANGFVEISWEQAAQEIGGKLKQIYADFGPRSVYYNYQSGAYYDLNSRSCWQRLLGTMGGQLGYYGSYSSAQVSKAFPIMFGSNARSTMTEIQHSDLHVFFGYNPMEIRQSGSGEGYEYRQLKGQAKTLFIDARYSDSMAGHSNEFYPCRPGTDAALCEAIAYHLIETDQIDEQFLLDKCYGFRAEPEMTSPKGETLPAVAYEDSYEGHILGIKDGTPKTPEWAAPICGVPAASIRNIADQIAKAKAPYIVGGYGIQRQANGENQVRAVAMVALMVGAVGKRGTNTGHMPNSKKALTSYGMPAYSEDGLAQEKAKISCFSWTDAIARGKEMTASDGVTGLTEGETTLGTDIKAVINFAGNTLLNQHSDCFATAQLLRDKSKCELIVVSDNHMTPSARFADYLLPDTTWLESEDFANQSYSAGCMSYVTALTRAIEPIGDTKDTYEMCSMIAAAMGKEQQFTQGKSYRDWLEETYQKIRQANGNAFPDTLEAFQAKGVVKKFTENDSSHCGLYDYVHNGGSLNTRSGKIEIYSHQLREWSESWDIPSWWLDKDNFVTPLAKYVVTWEGYQDNSDDVADKPLQLIGHHTKGRTHSSYHNVKWLREAVHDAVWVNPSDTTGYADGDWVIVESNRGRVKVQARVTDRIMPGVASLCQGAWFSPENGSYDSQTSVDIGGCVNTLTAVRPSPYAKGNPQHTNRVKIYKA